MKKFIISIDAGTTSNRSILFDLKGKPVFSSQKEFTQYFPKSGWVEHNPEEIWRTTLKTLKDVIKKAKKYKKPNNDEKMALEALIKTLDKCNDKMTPEDIQTLIYSTGKENGYSDNLRDWFKLIYQVVFGDENGPRMGFFISFFGVQETKDLIKNKIK